MQRHVNVLGVGTNRFRFEGYVLSSGRGVFLALLDAPTIGE